MLRPFFMTVALTVLAATAGAQPFPTQAIRLVIPYAPGGGSDILARPVGADMALKLKQPVIIDNKGGAGGNIGTQLVARSAPDGYNLLVANNSQAVNPFVYKNAGYDLANDFAPVTLLGTSPVIVVVHRSLHRQHPALILPWPRKRPPNSTLAAPGWAHQAIWPHCCSTNKRA